MLPLCSEQICEAPVVKSRGDVSIVLMHKVSRGGEKKNMFDAVWQPKCWIEFHILYLSLVTCVSAV